MSSIAHRLSGRQIALSGTTFSSGAAWAAGRCIMAPTSWASGSHCCMTVSQRLPGGSPAGLS